MKLAPFFVALLFSGSAISQDYPSRAVRLLVGYAPGVGDMTVSKLK